MKMGRNSDKRTGYSGAKEKDRSHNFDIYGEMVPSLYSWMTPEEQRRKTEQMNNMMENRDNDGKATDVDMGFKNNGLK
jgi:hypothetical protein